MGRGVVQNAMQGYNAALFAYGQTGSGKSYTMVGYGSNKGLVPMTCEELLRPVHENKNNEIQYQVTFSMLEIYNEQVRDLQVPFRKRQHEGLKIRQHPKSGFYVEGLKVGFQAMTWERLACFVTARVRSTTGGYVFSLSTTQGVPHLHPIILPLIPCPFGGGVTQ